MKKTLFLALLMGISFTACKNDKEKPAEKSEDREETVKEKKEEKKSLDIKIHPISHATMVLEWHGEVIYVDPVGGKEMYEDMPEPTLVLVTDIHADHLDENTLQNILTENSKLIAPKAVADALKEMDASRVEILNNEENMAHNDMNIAAVPMYNLRDEALQYHEKGRGNGYLLELKEERVYISGDTEDIPEMRALEAIDLAFVCMNLPYTMPVDRAADAVAQFQPKMVIPYHFRGEDGLSDVDEFERLVREQTDQVEVKQLNWYPEKE